MPSKGVDCHSYISVPGCRIEFSVPGQTITKTNLSEFANDHLEVDKKNIHGLSNFKGTFEFKVFQNDQQIGHQDVVINVLNGDLVGGNLGVMEQQKSFGVNDVIISFGFYDAGPGIAGLPKSEQVWVTVTPNFSGWMGQVAPPGSPQAAKPFSKFFLPAVHDVGMNSMENSLAVLKSTALIDVLRKINPTVAKLVGNISHDAAQKLAPDIVRGLAITQKDTLDTMLALGARYFEFRPAYLHNEIRGSQPIPDQLYFQHSAIPGMAYAQFLHDCVQFLMQHQEEIVVIQCRWDGVPAECARPSEEDLNNYVNNALSVAVGSIERGSIDDMLNMNIQDLREQRKRLIVFVNSDSFSTYTDEANATINGDSLIAEFDKITPEKQAGKPFTNLQCQATATNIRDVVVYSVLAADASSSCLLATKPICDWKTLPWIKNNAGRLVDGQLVVAMNDFFDGATADVCIDWSRRRLEG
ncbi:PLC-like phosphodiesterase [Tricladium varicosporioides]|nr:PLC-like phosphodiesterase [Hymenoscyphus varicosporioides]